MTTVTRCRENKAKCSHDLACRKCVVAGLTDRVVRRPTTDEFGGRRDQEHSCCQQSRNGGRLRFDHPAKPDDHKRTSIEQMP